jgi:hypothetical protein
MATHIRNNAKTFFNVLTGSLVANLTPIGAQIDDVTTMPNSAGK